MLDKKKQILLLFLTKLVTLSSCLVIFAENLATYLKQTEQITTPVSNHLQEHVKLITVGRLAVWNAKSERHQVKHRGNDEGAGTVSLETRRERYRIKEMIKRAKDREKERNLTYHVSHPHVKETFQERLLLQQR